MNNAPVRIKGYWHKEGNQGYTWYSSLDQQGNPVPYIPGRDPIESLPEHSHPTRPIKDTK